MIEASLLSKNILFRSSALIRGLSKKVDSMIGKKTTYSWKDGLN